MSTVQITPAFPPDISGVGDYAAVLSTEFDEAGEPMTTLVARPGARDAHRTDDVTYLPQPEAEALAQAIEGYDRVLLHFSGYGYARRGLCRWLVDGLSRWKARSHGRRLVTMFHEVYATGPIWRSSFWTSTVRKHLARDLARLSDVGFVSSRGGQRQLEGIAHGRHFEILPVFSNVGEPDTLPVLSDRSPIAVVFGGRTRRKRVYSALEKHRVCLVTAFNRNGISQILDIGPKIETPRNIGNCNIRPLGELSAPEVSAALSDACVGILDYPGHVFTKSGVAAAYFAHGLCIVNTSSGGEYSSGIEVGKNFLDLRMFSSDNFDLQGTAHAGLDWYRSHNIPTVADRFRNAMS